VDGFKIIPPMGLGSWIAFTPCADSVMMMGDIILTETDLAPVQKEVIRQGLSITAIHNHFVRNRPNVMYMHIDGFGNVTKVSAIAKAIFDKVKEVRGRDPKAGKADSVINTLNIPALDAIMGAKGEMAKGVYKYTIGRPDVMLKEHGIPISSFMGFNTWASWQGTPEKAAVAGDFTMLENEVAPVIKALVENGIEVVAVHNHMVHEDPKVFFLHYWGVNKPVRGNINNSIEPISIMPISCIAPAVKPIDAAPLTTSSLPVNFINALLIKTNASMPVSVQPMMFFAFCVINI
jgi:hypothetical protein